MDAPKTRFSLNRSLRMAIGSGDFSLQASSMIGPPGSGGNPLGPNFIFPTSGFGLPDYVPGTPESFIGFVGDYLVAVISLLNTTDDFVVNSQSVVDDGGNTWAKVAQQHYKETDGPPAVFRDISLWVCNVSNGLQSKLTINWDTTPVASGNIVFASDFTFGNGEQIFITQNSLVSQLFSDSPTNIDMPIDLNNFAFFQCANPESITLPNADWEADGEGGFVQELTTSSIQTAVLKAFTASQDGVVGVIIACNS